jgi:hypothetical protein
MVEPLNGETLKALLPFSEVCAPVCARDRNSPRRMPCRPFAHPSSRGGERWTLHYRRSAVGELLQRLRG